MSGTATKIRLVRCPKCRGILPELPNLQVYQCGGCGATLRAKIRKGESGSSETPVVNPAQANQNGSAEISVTSPVHNQSGSSETPETDSARNNQSETSETPDTSPSQNNQSGTPATHDTNPAQNNKLEHASITKELACSSQEVNKFPIEASQQIESAGCDKEHSGSTNFSNIIYFPGVFNSHDKKELFESVGSCETDGNNEKALNQRSPSSDIQLVFGGSMSTCTAQRALDKSLPAQTENSSAEEQLQQSQKIVRGDSDHAMSTDAVETTEDSIISDEEKIISKHRDALIESISQQTENSSAEELHSQKIVRRDSDHVKSKDEVETITEYIMSEKDTFSNKHRCLSNESISSQTYNFSSEQQLEQSQKIVHHDSDHERSHEASDNNVVSEEDILGSRLGNVSKSPATRCSHDYDASVSTKDGLEDQISDQHAHLFKCTPSEFVCVKDRPTSEYIPVNNKMNPNTDVRRFSSLSLNEKQGPVVMDKDTDWNQDILLDHTKNGIVEQDQIKLFQGLSPARNRMGLGKDIGKPFYQRGLPASHENGVFSNYRKKDFLHDSDFLSPSPHEMDYVKHNQVELLRKVDELRDQLNRSYAPKGNANGRFPTIGTQQEHPLPVYYNDEQSVQEVLQFNDAKYPWHPFGAYKPSKSAPHLCGVPRIPLSAEATNFGHHIDYNGWHGYPEERQRSLQVPLHNIYYNECQCRAHPVYMCSFTPCSSSRSGPQQHMSNFPVRWGYNTEPLPHNQGRMEHKVNNLYHRERERRNPIKQHFRPIAGGAPFVVCYSCSKLLHLPADFLLSRKRCHKLRCGSCSKVLLFSLNSRTIVPFLTNPAVPPPSGVDSCSSSSSRSSNVSTRKRLAYKSCANDYSQGDEVSYSEDYGLSILRNSCSTEDGPTVLTPASSHFLQSNGVDREHPSGSSAQPLDEREKQSFLKRNGDEHKNSIEAKVEKLSSGSKVVPLSSSPLHKLMGYSSPGEIIQGSEVLKRGPERIPSPSMDVREVLR